MDQALIQLALLAFIAGLIVWGTRVDGRQGFWRRMQKFRALFIWLAAGLTLAAIVIAMNAAS